MVNNYIILAAGMGTRLHPLTYDVPKGLLKLNDTTILQHTVDSILAADENAKVTVVGGFMYNELVQAVKRVSFIENPFYSNTNSVTSLWFARELLDGPVTIINGDVVMENSLVTNIVSEKFDESLVCVDSINTQGDYNVQVYEDKVVVMSKNLDNVFGEYAGITKLNEVDAFALKRQLEQSVRAGRLDQWYEDILVQLIFSNLLNLYYIDIQNYEWTEVDCVNDLLLAQHIVSK